MFIINMRWLLTVKLLKLKGSKQTKSLRMHTFENQIRNEVSSSFIIKTFHLLQPPSHKHRKHLKKR